MVTWITEKNITPTNLCCPEICVCVCERVKQKKCECVLVYICCAPAKLKPHSRWTVWINKCAWHYCLSFSLSSLPVSLRPWLHEGQAMSWLFAFRGLLSDLAAEQIQSCLKVKKLKSPELPPLSPSVCVCDGENEEAGRVVKKKTVCKHCLIFLEEHARRTDTHKRAYTADTYRGTQMSTKRRAHINSSPEGNLSFI